MKKIHKHFLNSHSSQQSCYGLYSIAIDRFLLHSAIDHWSLLDTAKILSSKFATVLCFATQEPFPFKGIDCLEWSLKNKSAILSRCQTPTIYHITSNSEIEHAKLPESPDIQSLNTDYVFANFIFKCVLAARLTDLNMSLNPSLHNDDQSFYLNLLRHGSITPLISTRKEQTIWEKGFLNTIYSILYLSESEQEIELNIKSLFAQAESHNNIVTQKVSLLYLTTYMSYLIENPE